MMYTTGHPIMDVVEHLTNHVNAVMREVGEELGRQ